jgi:hypothetical protein
MIKLLKQVLDALIEIKGWQSGDVINEVEDYIEPLRQLIADLEKQEPVAWESILGAVARGWCYEENANKTMDRELAIAIAKEVQRLYAKDTSTKHVDETPEKVHEPVARVIDDGTPEGSTEWIPFSDRMEPLKTGDLLYTSPQPLQQELVDFKCGDAIVRIKPPVYTSPQPREWVELTEEDVDQGLLRSNYALQNAHAWRAGVAFAMTKLREKNV